MEKDTEFILFGSENSSDYDVLVMVDDIPRNIDEAHNICKHWNEKLSKILKDKPLNCNIGVINDGVLVDCFKGTCDELNNVLYYTYKNHTQYFEQPIKSPIERNINEKAIRIARFIISFYSRTHLRSEIKNALRGTLSERLNVLKKIDFTKMTEFPKKKERKKDIYKVIAFQFGQIFSLIDGLEEFSYTKTEISQNYPSLRPMLDRETLFETDMVTLNGHLLRFIDWCEENLDMDMKESL